MSLFSGLGLTGPPPKPFDNVTLENGKAICLSHQEDLNLLYLSKGPFAEKSNFAVCSKCEKPEEMTSSCLAAFLAYSQSQCCAISPFLSHDASKPISTVKNPDMDFSQHVTEHILWDMNSNGYGLKSLVYMKDQKVLAACSKNGSISFWSIGEKVELIEPKLNLQRTVNFAKYCMISDSKKYLAIGTDKGVRIYHMTGDISSIRLLGVIDEEKTVSDFDFFESEGKIVTVYNESMAKSWSLDTLEMEKVVDLHQHGIKGEIYTVIYMEKTGELAVEHQKGLSVIKNWQHKDGHVRHHLVDEKNSFGCKYLPNSGVFIMSNGLYVEIHISVGIHVQRVKQEDFEVVEKIIMPKGLLVDESFPKRFLASQDESVIITNGALSHLFSYKKHNFQKHHLNHFVFGMNDLELMEDQYRIAVAPEHKGTVTIFRVNANMNIERSEDLSSLPAVSSTERLFHPNPGGGLFSGKTSNGGNNGSLFKGGGSGGGLLSGGGSGGSLFSGIAQGGSLFSGNGSGGSLFSGASTVTNLFSRNTNPSLRNPSSRVNNTGLFSSKASKKSTSIKSKQASKPAKKGKKIQKVQVRSKSTKKKKKSSPPPSVKKEKKKTTKTVSLKKQKTTEQNKNMIEAVRIKGKKKTKEEKVWIVLPSADDDDDGKKRGRSLKKTPKTQGNKSNQKGKRKADLSKDKGSRSRSKSKSVTRKQ